MFIKNKKFFSQYVPRERESTGRLGDSLMAWKGREETAGEATWLACNGAGAAVRPSWYAGDESCGERVQGVSHGNCRLGGTVRQARPGCPSI